MSQTKQECMEYIIVLLDDMKSEVKKIMHKDNYQTYDSEFLNVDYLKEVTETLFEEVGTLEIMFENCIPDNVRRLRSLESQNAVLIENIQIYQKRITELETKLSLSLDLKDA